MAGLSLTLLGGFALHAGGRAVVLPRKTQALVAYLAIGPRRSCSRDELATLLWGDTGDVQARASLRQALLGLRQALRRSAVVLAIDTRTVALDLAAIDADVFRLRRLIEDGSSDALKEAATLYQGQLLQGLELDEAPFEAWCVTERERLREAMVAALEFWLARAIIERNRFDAIEATDRLLAIDPVHEPAHRAVMRIHAAQGHTAAALRQYQRCVEVLRRELGVEPDAQTQQVYRTLVRDRAESAPARAPDVAVPPVDVPPAVETSPLIGRVREQERLRQAIAAAIGGRSVTVAILGEAGIGKSRLVARAAELADAAGARVLTGHAYAAEQILPLGPWLDAFRGAGIAPPRAADPAQLIEAIVERIDELAAARPLTLALEDVHWADDLSQRLFAVVARRLARRPLLVIVSARDDELDEGSALQRWLRELDREGQLARLRLGPLSAPEIDSLVRTVGHFTDDVTADAVSARVWAVSEGHPLMAVETLRAMEQGPLATPAAAAPIPARVREVVTMRLARLSDGARQLLAAAAAIGRDFDFELVRRAAAFDEGPAAAAIEELVRRRVVRVAGEGFEFAHERLREGAYDDMLPPRRRLVHRRIGETLEALHAADIGPHQAALGTHFHAAEMWDKAVRYLHGAGEWALARTAHREAAASLERALAASARLPESDTLALAIDLRLDLVRAIVRLGERTRAVAYLDEAARIANRLGDPGREGRVRAYLAFEALDRRSPDDVRRFATEACALGERAGDAELVLAGKLALGYAAVHEGAYRDACAIFTGMLAVMPDSATTEKYGPQVRPQVGVRSRLGESCAQLGEFDAARAHHREALAFAQRLDHGYSEAVAWWSYGETLLLAGDPNVRAELERGLAYARERESFWVVAAIQGALGWTRMRAGDVAEGHAMVRDALADIESRGITVLILSGLVLRGAEASLLAGDLTEARALADRALTLTRLHGERGLEAWALRLAGEVARVSTPTDVAAAEDAYRQALARATELEMRPLSAFCYLGLARLYHMTGRSAEGDAHHASAAALFRDIGMPPALG